MPKLIDDEETITFQGLTIADFLNKDFLDKIRKLEKNVDPISLIFMIKENGEKGKMYPIVIGHNNSKDLDSKIMTINVPKKISERLIKVLEEME